MFGGNSSLFDGAQADVITDFQDGSDLLSVGYRVDALLSGAAQASFADAATRAQQLFDAHAGVNEVAVVSGGDRTYVFYSSNNGGAADSAVYMIGLDSTVFSTADFL
jgi:hypothetical protein